MQRVRRLYRTQKLYTKLLTPKEEQILGHLQAEALHYEERLNDNQRRLDRAEEACWNLPVDADAERDALRKEVSYRYDHRDDLQREFNKYKTKLNDYIASL